MKINEVVDESIETKAGLTKDQKDAIGGRGKYKPKQPVLRQKPKTTQDYTSRAPVKLSPSITSKNYNNAMSRA